jgi:hypothetical protein
MQLRVTWVRATSATGLSFCFADFDQEKIKSGWKNIQVVQALKPVPGNGQVPSFC